MWARHNNPAGGCREPHLDAACSTASHAPKTVRHIACVVHGCFEKAVKCVKWQMIPRNSMDGIELPKLTKRPPSVVEKGSVTKILKQERGEPPVSADHLWGWRLTPATASYWLSPGKISFSTARTNESGTPNQVDEVREAAALRGTGRGTGSLREPPARAGSRSRARRSGLPG
ncbi:MAG: hypothetical protein JWN34_1239 [Bryobacterales bacterium]|nr:hypothetical protein [Bryobacterales bacterium]